MPEEKQPYELAYKDYKNGLRQKEIAEKYNVTTRTVGRWKNTYWNKWDKEKTGHLSNEKRTCKAKKEDISKKEKGGQPDNKNAVGNIGGGAPKGNQNNYKHGLFAKLMYDTLPDEVKELMTDLDVDEEKELILAMRICDAEIVRLFRLMREAEEKVGGQFIDSIIKSESVNTEGKINWRTTHTNTVSANDIIFRYRNHIQKYLRQKERCIVNLLNIGYDKNKLELDLIKVQAVIKINDEPEPDSSNLIEALQAATSEVWPG